jgi:DNA repair photolyase
MLTINEIQCKSIINRSGIPGLDYTINPYLGCAHGCAYCYARFMSKYTTHRNEWGSFVDIKINAPAICEKQIEKIRPGLVSLSTVTDPYQGAEKNYELTRQILMILAEHRFPVSILTKSGLVLRDIDILKRFEKSACEVGFSIATLDEKVHRTFEPHAPSVRDRIRALKTLHDEGIKTWIFIAPVLPVLTQQTLFELLSELKESADYILVDRLNIKCGNWKVISKALGTGFPEYLIKWKEMLFDREKRSSYNEMIYQQILDYCQSHKLKVRFC